MERDHGVGLYHAIDQQQAPAKLGLGNLLHAIVPIVEFEHIFKTEDRGHLRMLALIAEDVVRIGTAAGVFVVGSADNVAGVALRNELGAQSAGKIRQVIQMSVNRDEDLALMRLAWVGLFNNGVRGCALTQSSSLLLLGVFIHVLHDVVPIDGLRANVAKRLGILEPAKHSSHAPPVFHEELLHIAEVSRFVVVSQ